MEHIDIAIFNISGVTSKRKSLVAPIIILIAGILITWQSNNLDMMLPSVKIGGAITVVGIMLALYGLIALAINILKKKQIPIYNGKTLKRIEKFYDATKLQSLCKAVNNENYDEIAKIQTSSTSAVILVIYQNSDASFRAVQVLEYIPHQHVPATDMIIL